MGALGLCLIGSVLIVIGLFIWAIFWAIFAFRDKGSWFRD